MKNEETTDTKSPKPRTSTQNKSLHLFFTNLASTLNEAGLDMKAVLKPQVMIPWTPENVKEYLWKPVQRVLLHKSHTADLTTKEVSEVYEVFNRHLGESVGVYEPFPSNEEQMLSTLEE